MMIVTMKKEKEDLYYVWYRFELNVEIGTNLSKSGKLRNMFEPRYGTLKLSKNNFNKDLKHPHEPVLEIVKEKTDPIYFEVDKECRQRIVGMCVGAINQFKKGSDFPDYAARQIG